MTRDKLLIAAMLGTALMAAPREATYHYGLTDSHLRAKRTAKALREPVGYSLIQWYCIRPPARLSPRFSPDLLNLPFV